MSVIQPNLASAFAGALCLGAWAHDPETDRVALSLVLARCLAVPADAASAAPLALVLATVEVDDAARLENVLRAAAEDGCPFEAEFRAGSNPRERRWLRWMGQCRRDPETGARLVQGLAFDLTEGRRLGGPERSRAQRRINRLADHAAAMKGLVEGLRNPSLTRLIDEVAVEIGHELARHLRDSHGGRVH